MKVDWARSGCTDQVVDDGRAEALNIDSVSGPSLGRNRATWIASGPVSDQVILVIKMLAIGWASNSWAQVKACKGLTNGSVLSAFAVLLVEVCRPVAS